MSELNLVSEWMPMLKADIAAMREDLHDIRSDVHGMKLVQDEHTMRFEYLDEKMATLHESTMMALRCATNVEKLEKSK